MSKVAIMTDSNSGITQKEAKKLGVFVIPMPFLMGDETYYEDINLTQDGFYEKMEGGCNISTSQPSPEAVLNMFDELLKEVQTIAREQAARFEGTTQEVLIEEVNEHDGSLLTGRMSNNLLVHFPGEESLIGSLKMVHLKECKGFYYMGELAE